MILNLTDACIFRSFLDLLPFRYRLRDLYDISHRAVVRKAHSDRIHFDLQSCRLDLRHERQGLRCRAQADVGR